MAVLAIMHVNALLCHPTKSILESVLQYLGFELHAHRVCALGALVFIGVRCVSIGIHQAAVMQT